MRIPPNLRDMFPFPVETIKQLAQMVGQPQLVTALKEAAEKVGIKEPFGPGGVQQILQQAGRWVDAVTEGFTGRPAALGGIAGVNATGELFSHRWCNSPVSVPSAQSWLELMGSYADAEVSSSQLKALILQCTGASDAFVVSNTTAALYATALAGSGSTWVVPRVDCIKVPRFGVTSPSSLRDTLDSAGAQVREVGSNQECNHADIQLATSDPSSAVLLSSPNSLPLEHRASHIKNATDVATQTGAYLVRLLWDAQLQKVANLSVTTSVVSEQWTTANDILLVPCDAFLGGPEACLILAQKKLPIWQSLQRIVQVSGMEASSLQQACLLRSLRVFESEDQWDKTLLGQCLTNSTDNLKNRAERLAIQLSGTSKVERAVVSSKPCRIGSGIWLNEKLDSSIIQLHPRSSTVGSLHEYLKSSDRPIWTNAFPDHVELVLRTMEPDDDRYVAQRLSDDPIDSDARTESES